MRPNVLELIGSFEVGGSESQAVQLSRELQRSGRFNVTVACLERKGPLISRIDWQEQSGIPEYRLSSFFDLNFLTQVRRCAVFLRANNIDIVHTHDFYSNIFGMVSAYLARVPLRIASKRETFSKSRRQMNAERQAFRMAHQVVVNADMVRRFLIDSGVPSQKIVTIYNGLNDEPYAKARERLPAPPSDPVLAPLYGKRLVTIVANARSEVKNHSMFLEVAKRVSSELDSIEFIVAGEGELLAGLAEQARSLGIEDVVHFIGRCADVPALLSISEVCVLTSRSEGFANAILEYMAAGKPVVATKVGGAGEAVEDGKTGFLVESDDATAMARRVVELLNDPKRAKQFGQAAFRRVTRLFSVDAQFEKTSRLYEELLVKQRGRNVDLGEPQSV